MNAFIVDALEMLEAHIGNVVRVQVVDPVKTYEREMKAVESISYPEKGNDHTAWNISLRNLLVAYRPREHKAHNVFMLVREAFPNFEDRLQLNAQQRALFETAKCASSAVILREGPGGTGKTSTQILAALEFIQLKKLIETVLAMGPTNRRWTFLP